MAAPKNTVFDIGGINHLALVCKDMAKTVDFYTNVLGMPLIKTIDLPFGSGQHFFFESAMATALAFFWFPNAPAATPGVAAALDLPGGKAHGLGSWLDEPCRLQRAGRKNRRILRQARRARREVHAHLQPRRIRNIRRAPQITPTTFVRSIYFFDPDGICLEFASWTRAIDPKIDVKHEPVDASGKKRAKEPAE